MPFGFNCVRHNLSSSYFTAFFFVSPNPDWGKQNRKSPQCLTAGTETYRYLLVVFSLCWILRLYTCIYYNLRFNLQDIQENTFTFVNVFSSCFVVWMLVIIGINPWHQHGRVHTSFPWLFTYLLIQRRGGAMVVIVTNGLAVSASIPGSDKDVIGISA